MRWKCFLCDCGNPCELFIHESIPLVPNKCPWGKPFGQEEPEWITIDGS